MADFKTNLSHLAEIEHLAGLDVCYEGNVIHHIPAIEGKLGSLRVYYALAQQFNGDLNKKAAEKGLEIFAEHTLDAKQNPAKHPNIDLLLEVAAKDLNYQLRVIYK